MQCTGSHLLLHAVLPLLRCCALQKPKPVGSVRVEVGEIAKEGRIRDVWALRDAEVG